MSTVYRILIADDEEGVREAYRSTLTRTGPSQAAAQAKSLEDELFGPDEDAAPVAAGADDIAFELTIVPQGQDAVDAVRAGLIDGRPYALAFLDVRMPPGIDGVAAAQAIRALDPRMAIVLVTAYADIDLQAMIRMVPPAEKLLFLAKPFQPAEIQQHARALASRWTTESDLYARLEEQNAALRRIVAEAEQARIEAEQASAAKTLFLSSVGHELKTPLNAIIGFSDMIVSEVYGPVTDARYADYAREINISGQSLLGSINTILDAARLDTGRLALSTDPMDFGRTIRDAAASLTTLAAEGGVSIRLELADDLVIEGDSVRIKQIVHNVLHNAIRFTPPGGSVSLTLSGDGTTAMLAIADTGVGIKPDRIEQILAPFSQEDGTFTRRHEGLGLGLSIARGLAELHGGHLAIRSDGTGTVVDIRIPLAVPAQARKCA